MQIVKYQAGNTTLLQELAKHLPAENSLRYPDFVDYYYAKNKWSDLSLLMDKDSNEVQGVLGLDRMNFSVEGKDFTLCTVIAWYVQN